MVLSGEDGKSLEKKKKEPESNFATNPVNIDWVGESLESNRSLQIPQIREQWVKWKAQRGTITLEEKKAGCPEV